MMTRAQMMAFKDSAEMTRNHRLYYREVAAESNAAQLVAGFVTKCQKAIATGDEYFNRAIPLPQWDALIGSLTASSALKKRGDWKSFGTSVCTLKQAALDLANIKTVRDAGYAIATAAEFDALADKPTWLAERAATVRGSSGRVLYDPSDDDQGYMIWGENAAALAEEACEFLSLYDAIAERIVIDEIERMEIANDLKRSL